MVSLPGLPYMAEKGDINNMVNITKKPNRENYLKMTMI